MYFFSKFSKDFLASFPEKLYFFAFLQPNALIKTQKCRKIALKWS